MMEKTKWVWRLGFFWGHRMIKWRASLDSWYIYIYKGSGESGLRVYFLYPIPDPTSKQVDRILLEHTWLLNPIQPIFMCLDQIGFADLRGLVNTPNIIDKNRMVTTNLLNKLKRHDIYFPKTSNIVQYWG